MGRPIIDSASGSGRRRRRSCGGSVLRLHGDLGVPAVAGEEGGHLVVVAGALAAELEHGRIAELVRAFELLACEVEEFADARLVLAQATPQGVRQDVAEAHGRQPFPGLWTNGATLAAPGGSRPRSCGARRMIWGAESTPSQDEDV